MSTTSTITWRIWDRQRVQSRVISLMIGIKTTLLSSVKEQERACISPSCWSHQMWDMFILLPQPAKMLRSQLIYKIVEFFMCLTLRQKEMMTWCSSKNNRSYWELCCMILSTLGWNPSFWRHLPLLQHTNKDSAQSLRRICLSMRHLTLTVWSWLIQRRMLTNTWCG